MPLLRPAPVAVTFQLPPRLATTYQTRLGLRKLAPNPCIYFVLVSLTNFRIASSTPRKTLDQATLVSQ